MKPFGGPADKLKADNECASGGLRLMVLPARFFDNLGRGLDLRQAVAELCNNARCKDGKWNASYFRLALLDIAARGAAVAPPPYGTRVLIAECDGRSMLPLEHANCYDLYCDTVKGKSSVRGAGLKEASAYLSELSLSLAKVTQPSGGDGAGSSGGSAAYVVHRSIVVFGRALQDLGGPAGFFYCSLPPGFNGRTVQDLCDAYAAMPDGGKDFQEKVLPYLYLIFRSAAHITGISYPPGADAIGPLDDIGDAVDLFASDTPTATFQRLSREPAPPPSQQGRVGDTVPPAATARQRTLAIAKAGASAARQHSMTETSARQRLAEARPGAKSGNWLLQVLYLRQQIIEDINPVAVTGAEADIEFGPPAHRAKVSDFMRDSLYLPRDIAVTLCDPAYFSGDKTFTVSVQGRVIRWPSVSGRLKVFGRGEIVGPDGVWDARYTFAVEVLKKAKGKVMTGRSMASTNKETSQLRSGVIAAYGGPEGGDNLMNAHPLQQLPYQTEVMHDHDEHGRLRKQWFASLELMCGGAGELSFTENDLLAYEEETSFPELKNLCYFLANAVCTYVVYNNSKSALELNDTKTGLARSERRDALLQKVACGVTNRVWALRSKLKRPAPPASAASSKRKAAQASAAAADTAGSPSARLQALLPPAHLQDQDNVDDEDGDCIITHVLLPTAGGKRKRLTKSDTAAAAGAAAGAAESSECSTSSSDEEQPAPAAVARQRRRVGRTAATALAVTTAAAIAPTDPHARRQAVVAVKATSPVVKPAAKRAAPPVSPNPQLDLAAEPAALPFMPAAKRAAPADVATAKQAAAPHASAGHEAALPLSLADREVAAQRVSPLLPPAPASAPTSPVAINSTPPSSPAPTPPELPAIPAAMRAAHHADAEPAQAYPPPPLSTSDEEAACRMGCRFVSETAIVAHGGQAVACDEPQVAEPAALDQEGRCETGHDEGGPVPPGGQHQASEQTERARVRYAGACLQSAAGEQGRCSVATANNGECLPPVAGGSAPPFGPLLGQVSAAVPPVVLPSPSLPLPPVVKIEPVAVGIATTASAPPLAPPASLGEAAPADGAPPEVPAAVPAVKEEAVAPCAPDVPDATVRATMHSSGQSASGWVASHVRVAAGLLRLPEQGGGASPQLLQLLLQPLQLLPKAEQHASRAAQHPMLAVEAAFAAGGVAAALPLLLSAVEVKFKEGGAGIDAMRAIVTCLYGP